MDTNPGATPQLKRSLGLLLLVFYGLGVTVGAGIFALIGEILGLAGDAAPAAFLVAGVIAAATARTYSALAMRFPKAGGAAVYASEGLGQNAGRVVGAGVALTGVISSAVISLAFAGYAGALTGLPAPLLVVAIIAILTGVAAYGVRESIAFAAIITILEVGTLVAIAAFGLPMVAHADVMVRILAATFDAANLDILATATAIAFFAFIGFEDIVNLAEEARHPEKTLGKAIAITLGASTFLYVLIAAIATAAPDRAAIAGSEAPLADLFASISGLPAAPISVVASVAMVNGILVQIVMVSRVLYGMGSDGLLPAWIGAISPTRRTPIRATVLTAAAILALTFLAPMLGLAQATGYVTLAVFAAVNVSLMRLAARPGWNGGHALYWWGALGAGLCLALLAFESVRVLNPS